MIILEKIQEILNQEQEFSATIIEIFKTGSQLYISNPNDFDYVVICDGYLQRYRKSNFIEDNVHYDITIMDINALNFQLNFNNTTYLNIDLKLFNYNIVFRETVYGKRSIEWRMLDNKNEYLSYLSKKYIKGYKNVTMSPKFAKQYVDFYIPLKVFENNSEVITEEMRNDISKLYAGGEQSYDVVSWVKQKLNDIA